LRVVSVDVMIDCFASLFDVHEAGSFERLATQNAKSAFNLVKPRSVAWRKMKMDLWMALEPEVILGLVGAEIVENS
jgi:hypothetical protein